MNTCACCGCPHDDRTTKCARCRMECLPIYPTTFVTSCGIRLREIPAGNCACSHSPYRHRPKCEGCTSEMGQEGGGNHIQCAQCDSFGYEASLHPLGPIVALREHAARVHPKCEGCGAGMAFVFERYFRCPACKRFQRVAA